MTRNPCFDCFGWNKWSPTGVTDVLQAETPIQGQRATEPTESTRVLQPPGVASESLYHAGALGDAQNWRGARGATRDDCKGVSGVSD